MLRRTSLGALEILRLPRTSSLKNIWNSQNGYVGRNVCVTHVYQKKRKTAEEKKQPRALHFPPKSKTEIIDIWRNMTVADLARSIGKDVGHVFEALSFIYGGSLYKESSAILDNPDIVKEVVRKSGLRCRSVAPPHSIKAEVVEEKDVFPQPPAPVERLSPRPPVVTVMGHVDHGKTSLLDAIRKTRVVDSEFGGITQHIGAFTVKLDAGDKITFLDTPGHAAFSAMRERGANATDIVVLVVAADDGVMEQTVESIKMANNAGVPMIVAINKVDKPNADVERTKKMLIQNGVQVEDAGGDVQVVPVSALTGHNLQLLAEVIVLQAELMSLKADYAGQVEAVVVESKTDPQRGKLSTAIVKRGTLRKGTLLVAGTAWAKVRAMFDEEGRPVDRATPSAAVQIIGWRQLPDCGEIILEVDSERRANEVVRWRQSQRSARKMEEDSVAIKKKEDAHQLEYQAQLEARRKLGKYRVRRSGPREKEIKEDTSGPRVNVIIKGDVAGSVEAILDVIETYDCEEQCKLDVVHYGVGAVSENDVELASPFDATIYAFNVEVSPNLLKLAKDNNVTIKRQNVIYRLIDEIKLELSSKLPPKDVEEIIGEGKIQQIFTVSEGKKKIPVAGSRCSKGELKRDAQFKVIRDGQTIFDGELHSVTNAFTAGINTKTRRVLRAKLPWAVEIASIKFIKLGKMMSMRHLKNEVGTVKRDVECGLMFEEAPQFEPGDTIICYKLVPEPQLSSWDPGF